MKYCSFTAILVGLFGGDGRRVLHEVMDRDCAGCLLHVIVSILDSLPMPMSPVE